VFDHVYEDLPPELERQKRELLARTDGATETDGTARTDGTTRTDGEN